MGYEQLKLDKKFKLKRNFEYSFRQIYCNEVCSKISDVKHSLNVFFLGECVYYENICYNISGDI